MLLLLLLFYVNKDFILKTDSTTSLDIPGNYLTEMHQSFQHCTYVCDFHVIIDSQNIYKDSINATKTQRHKIAQKYLVGFSVLVLWWQ